MKNKKTNKKIKLTTKSVVKGTKSFVKKASNKAAEMKNTLQKQWKKEQPQREELMTNANKALEQGIKIGGDIFETIKKDMKAINTPNNKRSKNK
jgi:hypothetical protein